jgi:hypothetical protein
MATRLGTKMVNGRRIACASTSFQGGQIQEREYPQCRAKSVFFEVLRSELSLPKTTSMREVARILRNKSWDGQRWVEDSAQ